MQLVLDREFRSAFFSDQVDEEADKIRQERLAAYEAKKSKSKLGWIIIFVPLSNLLKKGYITANCVYMCLFVTVLWQDLVGGGELAFSTIIFCILFKASVYQ